MSGLQPPSDPNSGSASDLRTALQGAYEAADRPAPTYTDPAIAPGAVAIRAVHLTELRAAVVGLEQPAP